MKSFFFGFILMLLLIYGGPPIAKHYWNKWTNVEPINLIKGFYVSDKK